MIAYLMLLGFFICLVAFVVLLNYDTHPEKVTTPMGSTTIQMGGQMTKITTEKVEIHPIMNHAIVNGILILAMIICLILAIILWV